MYSLSIWNQSLVPRPVLNVAFWLEYRFLNRQVRWSGIGLGGEWKCSSCWSRKVFIFCCQVKVTGSDYSTKYFCFALYLDGRDWWAAIYGVAQSRTRLKWLSSSSSSSSIVGHLSLSPELWRSPNANYVIKTGMGGPGPKTPSVIVSG